MHTVANHVVHFDFKPSACVAAQARHASLAWFPVQIDAVSPSHPFILLRYTKITHRPKVQAHP